MPRQTINELSVIAITVVAAVTILAFDLSQPLGVAGGVPYVTLVLIAIWHPRQGYIYLMAVLGTLLTISGYIASESVSAPWTAITNRFLATLIIWITAILCARIRKDSASLNSIIDTAADGIISINEKGLIQSFNTSAESIFGYSAPEVLGRNISVLMPSPHREQHDSYIDRYIKTGERKIIGSGRRLQARHKDGYRFPIYLNISAVQQGRNFIFTGIIRDLSEEESKDARLRLLQQTVEQSPIAIVVTDTNGNIEYVNPHFSRVSGYSPEEVTGKNPRILKSGKMHQEYYRNLWQTITSGGIWRGIIQNRKKNGELFWESTTICPVRDQDGNIEHYIALKEDITDLREKESMLERAMKLEAIGRMTGGIAHDFNNLLTIILGNLQLLREDIDSEEDMELIEDALSAAQDGSNIINQLMMFSRRQEHVVKPTNVNDFLENQHRMLRRTIPADITLSLRPSEDIGTIMVDPNRLESAIINLITNARDAMPEGGKLIITTDKITITGTEAVDSGKLSAGTYVAISLVDNGGGMTGEVRRHALEPFFTTKTTTTGTGLGLSMTHDFIIQSGGGLRIDSVPGKGTTITLLLPFLETTEEQELEAEVLGQNELPTGSETVLLVEDLPKLRRFASRILSDLGYQVLEAENADEALDCLQSHDDIDLLFTDIILPGDMNGRQLALKSGDIHPGLKVLLTTGMERGTETGGGSEPEYPLLAKPYTASELAHTIRHILVTDTLPG